MTTEERVYEFIKAAVDAVTETTPTPDSALFDLEVHDHVYRKITKPAGIRIGTADGELSPSAGGEEMNEYNCSMLLVVFVRIPTTQKDGDERTVAMRQAVEIAKAVSLLFWDNSSCDERFRDTRIKDFIRGYDSLNKADHYAIVNLTLRVNEVGGSIGR